MDPPPSSLEPRHTITANKRYFGTIGTCRAPATGQPGTWTRRSGGYILDGLPVLVLVPPLTYRALSSTAADVVETQQSANRTPSLSLPSLPDPTSFKAKIQFFPPISSSPLVRSEPPPSCISTVTLLSKTLAQPETHHATAQKGYSVLGPVCRSSSTSNYLRLVGQPAGWDLHDRSYCVFEVSVPVVPDLVGSSKVGCPSLFTAQPLTATPRILSRQTPFLGINLGPTALPHTGPSLPEIFLSTLLGPNTKLARLLLH